MIRMTGTQDRTLFDDPKARSVGNRFLLAEFSCVLPETLTASSLTGA